MCIQNELLIPQHSFIGNRSNARNHIERVIYDDRWTRRTSNASHPVVSLPMASSDLRPATLPQELKVSVLNLVHTYPCLITGQRLIAARAYSVVAFAG